MQVAIRHVDPATCTVDGEIVRIFRDLPGDLATGTAVRFLVECLKPGDEVPVGGTLWTGYDSLMRARFIEAYLVRERGGFRVVLWQTRIIEQPTAEPRLPVE